MAIPTPNEAAEKWARRLSGAVEDIRRGVSRVQTAPTELAAQKRDKYLTGVQEAVQSGKWEAGLRRVGLEDWRRATIEKGLNRIASGAQSATPKMQQFLAEFLPHVEAGVARVKAMPDMTIEDRINRAVAMMRHNAQFRRR